MRYIFFLDRNLEDVHKKLNTDVAAKLRKMPTESEEFSSLVDETSLFLTRLNSYDDEEKRILKAAVDFMAKFLTGKEKDRVILESIIESTLLKQSFCSVIEYALIYTERKGFVNVFMHVFLNNGQKEGRQVTQKEVRNEVEGGRAEKVMIKTDVSEKERMG